MISLGFGDSGFLTAYFVWVDLHSAGSQIAAAGFEGGAESISPSSKPLVQLLSPRLSNAESPAAWVPGSGRIRFKG